MKLIKQTVLTVSIDKIAANGLDASARVKFMLENEYKKPNMENLSKFEGKLLDKEQRETCFISVDMLYAYGQVELAPETTATCGYQYVG